MSLPLRKLLPLLAGFALIASPALAEDGPWQPNADGEYLPDPSQEVPLSEEELIEAFSDKTHRVTYNLKRQNIESFAFEETTTSDGKTRHIHGDKVDTGTWRVKANVICFSYDNWNGGTETFCFNIYKRGNCFYHYGLNSGGNFSARTVHAGEIPDCEPSIV